MFHTTPEMPGKGPKDLDILHSLASANLLFGQTSKAISLLRLAYWYDPNCLKTIELIAHAAFRAGDIANAVHAVEHLEGNGAPVPRSLQLRRRLATKAGED
ncbi:MAG: hypothetical protein HC844_03860 [Tabrizicola sp.]|nr:hypothetical protein [Tabrizicola sp.]